MSNLDLISTKDPRSKIVFTKKWKKIIHSYPKGTLGGRPIPDNPSGGTDKLKYYLLLTQLQRGKQKKK